MDILSYTPVALNILETLAKTLIITDRQNQLFQENTLNNSPIRRFTIAMNTNSAFTGLYTENPLRHQQFGLRQIRILRGAQPILHFVSAENFCLNVATMKSMNFQGSVTSNTIDIFQDHYVLVFDLTSIQDANEKFHNPEFV